MRFPLTDRVVAEADRFALRAGCRHCFHRVPVDGGGDGEAPGGVRCGNGWPLEGQERFPLGAAAPGQPPPTEVVFCREFELA